MTHPALSQRHAVRSTCLLAAAIAALAACSPKARFADGVVAGPSIVQAGAPGAAPSALTAAELDRRIADLFGDANAPIEHRLSVDSALPGGGDAYPVWDIDVFTYATYDRVQHYVAAFTGPARERIADRLSEGTRYESMIRSKLRAGGLPEDMYYLALVESGFNPHAYSRAAAVGMWQFMTSTGRGMGLRIDWWVDERRDPIRSTDAAVRFLRGLNEQFGSMYLAAAAYNGGPGRIARGLNRYEDDLEGTSGDDLFFALLEKKVLRQETSNYVPQLIAAALVAKESGRYGLEIVQRPTFVYDSVRVPPLTPLPAIAAATRTGIAEIQRINPHILRGMTPPGRESFLVRIPVGTRERFDSAFATLDSASRVGARTITLAASASWATIAEKEPVSARAIASYNPKVKPHARTRRVAAGTRIVIPTRAAALAALDVPDPSVERYGTGTRTHVVRAGENLSVIAKRYRTTPASIMRLNRLKKDLIFPGQELLVASGRR